MSIKSMAWLLHRCNGEGSEPGVRWSSLKPERARLADQALSRGFTVPNQASATVRALESDAVSRLAKFFPEATPVRIPIHLSRAIGTPKDLNGERGAVDPTNPDRESWRALPETVIEYGTSHEVLFVVSEPVEFADRVLVESKDGALRAEASIVAVQYHPERTAVAARFLNYVPNWIVKS